MAHDMVCGKKKTTDSTFFFGSKVKKWFVEFKSRKQIGHNNEKGLVPTPIPMSNNHVRQVPDVLKEIIGYIYESFWSSVAHFQVQRITEGSCLP